MLLVAFLFGCTPPPRPEAPETPPVEPAQPGTPSPVDTKTPTTPSPPAKADTALNVDLIVSADLPDYLQVAERLRYSIEGQVRTHFMKGNPQTARIILPNIAREDGDQIVAIGLLAARAARQLPDRQLVFCQVFNVGDANLVGDSSKGVALIPGPAFQLATWKRLQPDLARVGLIIGPNQQALTSAAIASARELGLRLSVREVRSDKEMLVALREMAPDIDGLWLLPDNRVLSTTTLRTAMSYSLRQGITIAGFDHQLLAHGALLTIAPRPDEVARAVLERLEAGKGKSSIPGPGVVFLDAGEVRVNARMAERLGLPIPAELRANDDAP